jgi:hypothetical protein
MPKRLSRRTGRLNLPGISSPIRAICPGRRNDARRVAGRNEFDDLALGFAEVCVFGKRDRLSVRIFGILGAVAEGPIAICALVLIVLLITQALWAR